MDHTEHLRLDLLHSAPIGFYSLDQCRDMVIIDTQTKEKLAVTKYYVTRGDKGLRLVIETGEHNA